MKTYQIMQRTMAKRKVITLPMATIKGKKSGPSLAIIAGVHGCEYCGIEATIWLYRDLKPEEMSGTVRMVMCANSPAFRARTMYVAEQLSKGPDNFALFEAAARIGKVGLGVEAGSQGRRDRGDVLFHYNGILNIMRYLGMIPGSPTPPREELRIMDKFLLIKAGTEGIFYPFIGSA